MKKIHLLGLTGALLLSGCTEMRLANHVYKQVAHKPAPYNAPAVTGKRKIGKPYKIDGITYYPIASSEGYRKKGIASWYGKDFHGKKTANGEIYNMYAMTAAHPTLPIPTWVRVTNLENGRSIMVRVNDRGPFLRGRLIDLSYRAAAELDMVEAGVSPVLVEALPTDGSPLKSGPIQVAQYGPNDPRSTNDGTATGATGQGRQGFTHRVSAKENSKIITPKQPEPAQAIAVNKNPSKRYTNPYIEREQKLAPHPNVDARQQVTKFKKVAVFVQTGAFSSETNAQRQKAELAKMHDGAQVTTMERGGQTLHRVRVGPLDNVEEADTILASLVDAGYHTAIIAVE